MLSTLTAVTTAYTLGLSAINTISNCLYNCKVNIFLNTPSNITCFHCSHISFHILLNPAGWTETRGVLAGLFWIATNPNQSMPYVLRFHRITQTFALNRDTLLKKHRLDVADKVVRGNGLSLNTSKTSPVKQRAWALVQSWETDQTLCDRRHCLDASRLSQHMFVLGTFSTQPKDRCQTIWDNFQHDLSQPQCIPVCFHFSVFTWKNKRVCVCVIALRK